MNVEFKNSFAKDIGKIKNKILLLKIKSAIEEVEEAPNIQTISNLKKLKGEGHYFRIRIGDYRIGLKLEKDTFVFIRFLHRRKIYRYFP